MLIWIMSFWVANAATIQSVDDSGNLLTLQLASDEVGQFAKGDAIEVHTRGKPIAGEIVSIQGDLVKVRVKRNSQVAFKKGRKVNVAALGSDASILTASPPRDRPCDLCLGMLSPNLASTVQLFRVTNWQVDGAVEQETLEGETGNDALKAKVNVTASTLGIGATKKIAGTKVFAGGLVYRSNTDIKSKVDSTLVSGADQESEDESMGFEPFIGYEMSPSIVLAAGYGMIQSESTGDSYSGSVDLDYMRTRGSVLAHNHFGEIGVEVSQKISQSKEYRDSANRTRVRSRKIPMTSELFGRAKVSDKTTAVAHAAFLNNAAFNDSRSAPMRNSWDLKAGVEGYVADRTTLGVNVIGQTPTYVNRRQMGFGSIAEYGLQALAGYRAGRATKLGGSLAYTMGEEKEGSATAGTSKIESNQVTFRIEASSPL